MSDRNDLQEMIDGLKSIPEEERAEFLAAMRPRLYAIRGELAPVVLARVLIEKGLLTATDFDLRSRELVSTYVDLLLNAVGAADATAERAEKVVHTFLTGYLVEGFPKEDR